jgi:hypothetical protein
MIVVVWMADFLPDILAADTGVLMEAGARAMKVALNPARAAA